MKTLFLIIAATITLSACGTSTAGTATSTTDPTTTTASRGTSYHLASDLETITGEEIDPLTAVAEAEKVCRQMSYINTKDELTLYLGAYHWANRRSATPESTGRMLGTMMAYSCPATALNMSALLK